MSNVYTFPARRTGKTWASQAAITAQRHRLAMWTVEVTSAALDGRITDAKAIALLDALDRQAIRLNRMAEGLRR